MTAQPDTATMLKHFTQGLKSFERTEFKLDPREELEGDFCDVTVVFRENGDVIFQLFPKKTRRLSQSTGAGRRLLAEMLEVYFGSTDTFSASWVAELDSWAVKATGLANLVSYSKDHHIYGFAQYLNQALADLK